VFTTQEENHQSLHELGSASAELIENTILHGRFEFVVLSEISLGLDKVVFTLLESVTGDPYIWGNSPR
jgi:hypothetical protein